MKKALVKQVSVVSKYQSVKVSEYQSIRVKWLKVAGYKFEVERPVSIDPEINSG